MVTDLNGNRNF